MKKTFIYILSVIAFLLLFSVITVNILLNPNNYKEEIVAYVSKSIDYNFSFEGDIELLYSPDIYLSVPNIEISAKNGRTPNPIAKARKLKMSVLFLPLMQGTVDVQNIQVAEGEVIGFNIDATILKTYAIAKRMQFVTGSKNSTKFERLDAEGTIVNKIMNIREMNIETDLVIGKGTGIIDLNNKVSSLKVIAKIKDDEATISKYGDAYPYDLKGRELPIEIKGELESPSISVDLTNIIKYELEELKDKAVDKIKEKIEEKIKLKLPF
ncbi:MAG: hypothetical protein CMD49_02805 [Gammaproteobacteria bacterium]|nr:hypothetical protein [Gammaproteobacteria bacterium]